MSYSAGVFYLDLESGSDTARTALLGCVISNPSGTVISVNKTAHGLVAGAIFDATLFSVWFNGAWKVLSVTDADNFIVDGIWQATADNNGTITPRGGSSKADAWKTYNSGATSARVASGDTVRVKASTDAVSLGVNGTFTDERYQDAATSITSSTNATPIVINRSGHPFVTGDTIVVEGHSTNTNANGWWKITVSGANITLLNADGTNSVGNGAGGATGTMRKVNSACVLLASAVTKNIALIGNQGSALKQNWTASANVTSAIFSSASDDYSKEGFASLNPVIAATFGTGKACYFALPATLDLSAYQKVSFWFRGNVGTFPAGSLSLRLCSDAIGAVTVNTIALPATVTDNTKYCAVTVDNGSALGNAIASIALYVDTDVGAQNLSIDCIFATSGPGVGDLIGKSTSSSSGPEFWWPIRSINDKRIVIDQGGGGGATPIANNSTTSPSRGYSGVSETVTTYWREPIKLARATSAANPAMDFRAGVNYSGGWDRTNMTSQSGDTWVSGQNGADIVFSGNTNDWSTRRVHYMRFAQMKASLPSNGITWDGCIVSCIHSLATLMFGTNSWGNTWTYGPNEGFHVYAQDCNDSTGSGLFNLAVGGNGTFHGTTVTPPAIIGTISVMSCGVVNSNLASAIDASLGIALTEGSRFLPGGTVTSKNNSASGIDVNNGRGAGVPGVGGTPNQGSVHVGPTNSTTFVAKNNKGHGFGIGGTYRLSLYSVTSTSNGYYGIVCNCDAAIQAGSTSGNVTGSVLNNYAHLDLRDFTISEGNPVQTVSYGDGRTRMHRYAGTANDHRQFNDGGTIFSETSVRHTASGLAWKFSPTDTSRSANFPVSQVLPKFSVVANKLVTVTAYMRRTHTDLTMSLVCRGGQLSGVGSDVISSMTAAANTWEQVTITFTPTEAGVIEVEAWAYGTTTQSGYLDDVAYRQDDTFRLPVPLDYVWRAQPWFNPLAQRRVLLVT